MKTRSFHLILLFTGTLILSSCAKLPVYESKKLVTPEKDEFLNPLANNFDKKTNVQYGVANDDTNLYLQAIFHNRESLMKIMRGGLSVYFDPEGKKKKNYQLKIEKTNTQLSEYELIARQGNRDLNNPQRNMAAAIDLQFNKVTWDKNGNKHVFLRNNSQEKIIVKLGPNKQNELMLEVRMPLSELPLIEGRNIFSLGIETESMKPGGMSEGRPGGAMGSGGGMRPSGAMGGGMRGGGMRGSGGRGMRGSGNRSGGNYSSGMEPIRIWFQVQL